MHWAARKGNHEVVVVLYANKAKDDVKNKHGKTALQYARYAGHASVRALLEVSNLF